MRDTDAKAGVFVVDPKGRVGMIARRISGSGYIIVKYGPDGPQSQWARKDVRPATEEDVKTAGLAEVGGRILA